MNDKYENFFKDFLDELLDRSKESCNECRKLRKDKETEAAFQQGYQMALYGIATLIKSNAELFEIHLSSIDNFDPDIVLFNNEFDVSRKIT